MGTPNQVVDVKTCAHLNYFYCDTRLHCSIKTERHQYCWFELVGCLLLRQESSKGIPFDVCKHSVVANQN